MLLGGAIGLGVAWVYTALALRFPDQSLIGYSKRVLGRWLGGLAGLLYIWYGVHLGALVLRNFGEFLVSTILPATPISVPVLFLMAVCAYGVRHGLEVLGRAAQVITGVVLVQVLLDFLLLVKDFRWERLMPVFGEGIVPILKEAFAVLAFPFGETILFALLLPMARPTRQIRPTVTLTMAGVVLLLAIITIRNVGVLGVHIVGTELFPTFGATRIIEVADFVTRLDALVVGSWVATGFVKVAVCILVTARGAAEWAGVQEYRPLVLPLGAIMAALSVILYDNTSEMATFAFTTYPIYSFPLHTLVPLLLLSVAAVRGLRAKTGRE